MKYIDSSFERLNILLYVYKFQVEIDVASSIVARGLTNLVVGYMMNLVVEMAFLIQVKEKKKNLTISFEMLSFPPEYRSTHLNFVRKISVVTQLICAE